MIPTQEKICFYDHGHLILFILIYLYLIYNERELVIIEYPFTERPCHRVNLWSTNLYSNSLSNSYQISLSIPLRYVLDHCIIHEAIDLQSYQHQSHLVRSPGKRFMSYLFNTSLNDAPRVPLITFRRVLNKTRSDFHTMMSIY